MDHGVGVEHHRAHPREGPRGKGFASADRTRQAEDDHGFSHAVLG